MIQMKSIVGILPASFWAFVTLLSNCMYTGGYDIVSGTKAREEITSKVSTLSAVGTATIFSGSVSCPSGSSSTTTGTVTEETESNDTFKNANQYTFPPTDGTQVRVKGTVSSFSDYDIFYAIPPSTLTTPAKIYYRMSSGTATCFIFTSDVNDLSNDTNISVNVDSSYGFHDDVDYTSTSSNYVYSTSDYIFIKCQTQSQNKSYSYDIVLSMSDITTTSSASSSTISSWTSSYLLGQVFMYSKIDTGKKYTKTSLDNCLNKLQTTIPVVSYVHAYSLLSSQYCGTTYIPFTEYMAAGLTCNLEEASFIQLGNLGVP